MANVIATALVLCLWLAHNFKLILTILVSNILLKCRTSLSRAVFVST
jgi:hypothetical protein